MAISVLSVAAAPAARARTLMVGTDQPFARPSEAARVAAPGDIVHILPGTYFDCAIWSADHLVIEGGGPGTVMTDVACQGKASFVISGNDVTVRDLTLTRVRVADGNGAGIRAEGAGLLVQRVRFDNDQAGLLAVDQPGAVIEIIGCVFLNNGTTTSTRVPASIEVGALRRLTIRNSVFESGKAGAAIVSHADLTEIDSSRFAASPHPANTQPTPTIQISGALTMIDSELEASDTPGGGRAAVRAVPGISAPGDLTLRHNRLDGDGILLLNWSARPVVLDGNHLQPDAIEESSSGAWSYQLRRMAHGTYDTLNAMVRHWARQAIDAARREWARNP